MARRLPPVDSVGKSSAAAAAARGAGSGVPSRRRARGRAAADPSRATPTHSPFSWSQVAGRPSRLCGGRPRGLG